MTAVSADVAKLTKRENISDMDGSLPADGAFNYESILSALDFPMEDIDDSVEDNDWDTKFQDIEPPPNIDQLLGPGIFSYDDEKKHTNLSTPYGHMYQRPQFPSVTCEPSAAELAFAKMALKALALVLLNLSPNLKSAPEASFHEAGVQTQLFSVHSSSSVPHPIPLPLKIYIVGMLVNLT
nr:uncharacterized protein LOC103423011 [Malus domestica]